MLAIGGIDESVPLRCLALAVAFGALFAEAEEAADANTNSTEKIEVAKFLPRPISSDTDRTRCEELAETLRLSMEKMLGEPYQPRTVARRDGVVQFDDVANLYHVYYPNGLMATWTRRNGGRVVDVNIQRPFEHRLLHLRIEDEWISISKIDEEGNRLLQLEMMKLAPDEDFTELGDWTVLDDPERLRDFCRQCFDEYLTAWR